MPQKVRASPQEIPPTNWPFRPTSCWALELLDSVGVPRHSNFEPDYFLAKGNGKPAANCCLKSQVWSMVVRNESSRSLSTMCQAAVVTGIAVALSHLE